MEETSRQLNSQNHQRGALGNLAGSYFTESGREEQDRQSRLIRETPVEALMEGAFSNKF